MMTIACGAWEAAAALASALLKELSGSVVFRAARSMIGC